MSYEEKYNFVTHMKTIQLFNIKNLMLSGSQNICQYLFLLIADNNNKSWQIILDLFKNIFYEKIEMFER